MKIPDFINGCFEAFASLFILNHCRVLLRHKQVRGVSLTSTGFFFGWGLWNVVFYPLLGQWFSFACGLAVLAANGLWIAMLFYYRKR